MGLFFWLVNHKNVLTSFFIFFRGIIADVICCSFFL